MCRYHPGKFEFGSVKVIFNKSYRDGGLKVGHVVDQRGRWKDVQ